MKNRVEPKRLHRGAAGNQLALFRLSCELSGPRLDCRRGALSHHRPCSVAPAGKSPRRRERLINQCGRSSLLQMNGAVPGVDGERRAAAVHFAANPRFADDSFHRDRDVRADVSVAGAGVDIHGQIYR